MGWYLAFGAALCFVALDILRKILGRRTHPARVVIGIFAGAALFQGLLLLHLGIPTFDRLFVLLAVLEALTFTATSILYVQAVALAPLSTTIPYLGVTPLVSAVTALAFHGEHPPAQGWVGIVLLLAGALALRLEPGTGIRETLQLPLKDRASARMLLIGTIWGVTTSVDKLAIRHGSELLLGFSLSALGCGFAYLVYRWQSAPTRTQGSNPDSPAPGRSTAALLVLAAVLGGLAMLLQFFAYRELMISYVEAVKRCAGLLSVAAGLGFFGESYPVRRLLAAGLMAVGVLLLTI